MRVAEQCSINKTISQSQHIKYDAKHMFCFKNGGEITSFPAAISTYFQGVLMAAVSVLAAGLQAILPEYLRARFVQAALSYIGCNEEGQLVCRDNDCWCQCAVDYPQCNCPEVDLTAMETSLLKIRDSWTAANQDFEESGQTGLDESEESPFTHAEETQATQTNLK